MIRHYDSIGALRADYLKHQHASTHKDSWLGGESRADAVRYSETGKLDLVPFVEAFLDKVETEIQVPRREVAQCIAGGWADVPSYLAGNPLSMRRVVHVENESAPINIYVDTTSSAGIKAKVLEKRGCAILALVMMLTRSRPVALFQLNALGKSTSLDPDGEVVLITRINTSPLDLATACYILTSQAWTRGLGYDLSLKTYGADGSWPLNHKYGNPKAYGDYLTAKLGLDPQNTLMVNAVELHDLIVQNPVKWINNQVAYFTHNHNDTEE